MTIGIPAFALTFTQQAPRHRPGFLRRVLLRSVPAGVVAGLAVVGASSAARALDADTAGTKSAAAVALGVIGLVVVLLVARPLRPVTVGLVVAMAALFTAAVVVPATAEFFAVQTSAAPAAAAIACGIVGGACIALLWRVLERRTAPPGTG